MKTFDDRWEEVHSSREWGKYPSEDVVRFVARNYYSKERSKIKILDFGCGQGANTLYLAKENFNTYAFDGSASAVEAAKKRVYNEKLSANIIVCDASNTTYKNECFDCVIDSAVIYANKVSDIELILKEVYRILKSGGKIFSTGLFTKDTTGYGTGEVIEKNTYRNLTDGTLSGMGTVHFFEKEEILELWSKIGFNDIKIDTTERTDYNGKFKTSNFMVQATK